jgi:hypothetical protein
VDGWEGIDGVAHHEMEQLHVGTVERGVKVQLCGGYVCSRYC